MTLSLQDENISRNLRESDDDFQYPLHKKSKYENIDRQINEIDYEIERIKPKSFNTMKDRNETKKLKTHKEEEKNTSLFVKYEDKLYSLIMKEPIIKKENFLKALSKTINKKEMDLLNLKLLDYAVLKEIIYSCGSFPEKSRNHIWKFLLSLPQDKHLFEFYAVKGIHPFYKNLNEFFQVKDTKDFLRLQHICSLISFWSPHIGNIYFLPNFIYPFIKYIRGDDLFLFELLIAIMNTYCQYWFEFYPGAPLNHLKICEKIIQKESHKLFSHLKKLEEEFSTCSMKVSEIIWRFFKNFFSETFCKESFLQLVDFVLTHNHKPEILIYVSCSILINLENILMKCKTPNEVETVLFKNDNNEKRSLNLNLMKIFKKSLRLMEKYSSFQIYKYKPYIPFPDGRYPNIENFPLDFLGTTGKLKEELFKEEENFILRKTQIEEIEKKVEELSKREKMMQRCYESLIHKEKEKGEIMKRELDLIIYQKEKFYEELKNRKLQKIDKLENLIDSGLKFYEKMNSTEISTFEEEMRKKKTMEEFDLKQRLQQEELNNLEFNANRKILQLVNLRSKDEEDQKFKNLQESKEKEREMKKRIYEEKWRLEDEAMQKRLEYLRNMKEIEYLHKNDENQIREKELRAKIKEYEEELLIREVERERKNRELQQEFEENMISGNNLKNNRGCSAANDKIKPLNEIDYQRLDQENMHIENKNQHIMKKENEDRKNLNQNQNKENYSKGFSKNEKIPSNNNKLISIYDEDDTDPHNQINRKDKYFDEVRNNPYNSYNEDNLNNIHDYSYNYNNPYLSSKANFTNNNNRSYSNSGSNIHEFSSPSLSSENKNSTQTNLRLINEGIRNISTPSSHYQTTTNQNKSKYEASSGNLRRIPMTSPSSQDIENYRQYIQVDNKNKHIHNINKQDYYDDILTSSYNSENESRDSKAYYPRDTGMKITSPNNFANHQMQSDSLFSLSKSKNIASLGSLSLSNSNR